jgi:chaperone required for assembly of F1-ATPase
MRDFLEDAEKHRDDGYGRAQKHVRQQLPKRFYKEAGVAVVEGGFAVTLDGKPTRTPGRAPMVLPLRGLAEAVAVEWAAQGELINPDTMPVLRLMNAAVEGGAATRDALAAEVVKYAGNDLLLYRAEAPRELVAEQEALWDPILIKVARQFGVSFQPTMGIIHQPQPPLMTARLGEVLAGEDHMVLTALVSVTGISGSGIMAIALWHGLISAEEVWLAAHVDEDYQMRFWGAVEEAVERRAERRRDFDAAVRVLEMLRTRQAG